MEEIYQAIPQRPPFLFIDKIISQDDSIIITERLLKAEEDFFRGHFPSNPIMPGVLLCEACFQTGSILMSKITGGLGVVTRINMTKFKNFAKPGDLLIIEVTLKEQIANAFLMKGRIRVEGKTILQIEFMAASIKETN